MNQSTKNYKRFAVCFTGIFGILSLIGFAFFFLLWLYDPLILFHKPIFRKQTIMYEKNLPVYGIIDFIHFDSVFLGSSMFQNTIAKEADKKIGGKWFNFAIGSSRVDERETLLQYILKHKQIKQVAYSLDNYILVNGEFDKIEILSFNGCTNDFYEKFKIYLNEHFIKCAVKWSKDRECIGRDFTYFGFWYNPKSYGFKNWTKDEKQTFADELKFYETSSYKTILTDIDERIKIQEYIKQHILFYVEQNPQITFHFILPVQSRFFWKIPYFWNDGQHFGTDKKRSPERYYNDYRAMILWFMQEIAKYPNVKVYGFDNLDYADNLDNYNDARHYNVDMNSMQLDAIANGTHILTPQNIDKYLATMEQKIKNYDIAPLIAEIKQWEVKSKEYSAQ